MNFSVSSPTRDFAFTGLNTNIFEHKMVMKGSFIEKPGRGAYIQAGASIGQKRFSYATERFYLSVAFIYRF